MFVCELSGLFIHLWVFVSFFVWEFVCLSILVFEQEGYVYSYVVRCITFHTAENNVACFTRSGDPFGDASLAPEPFIFFRRNLSAFFASPVKRRCPPTGTSSACKWSRSVVRFFFLFFLGPLFRFAKYIHNIHACLIKYLGTYQDCLANSCHNPQNPLNTSLRLSEWSSVVESGFSELGL